MNWNWSGENDSPDYFIFHSEVCEAAPSSSNSNTGKDYYTNNYPILVEAGFLCPPMMPALQNYVFMWYWSTLTSVVVLVCMVQKLDVQECTY